MISASSANSRHADQQRERSALLLSHAACPECRCALEPGAQLLVCSGCRRSWPILGGVPHFGGTDGRQHPLSVEQRASVVRTASDHGWQVALHDRLRSIDQAVYRQAIDEYRAQWRFVLPLTAASRVLDLQCGWGATALNLAECCAEVVAADASSALARFVALRSAQMDRRNIVSVQLGLDQPLPFGPTFDVVVLVDALRWLARADAQRRLLRRVRKVLRPGGLLFVADLNRVGVDQLAKGQLSRATHTLSGYRRLLHQSGFRCLDVYAPLPSHLEPFFVVPLDRPLPLSYVLHEIIGGQDFGAQLRQRGLGSLYGLARRVAALTPATWLARAVRPVVPSVAIVAQM